MIKVENLEFTYPKSKKKAVNGISFQIKKGEIFGFLGPNGAGKTTTQKVIIGLLKGYGGNVEILGKDLQNWRSDLYERIGVGFETPNHYQKLTALENLELFASFYSRKTIDPNKLLKMVDLHQDANQKGRRIFQGYENETKFCTGIAQRPTDTVFR